MGDINIATKNLLSKFGDSKLMKTMINKLADPFKDLDPNAVDLTVKVSVGVACWGIPLVMLVIVEVMHVVVRGAHW